MFDKKSIESQLYLWRIIRDWPQASAKKKKKKAKPIPVMYCDVGEKGGQSSLR